MAEVASATQGRAGEDGTRTAEDEQTPFSDFGPNLAQT